MVKRTEQEAEERLVEKASQGDAGAFGRLYERYLDPIYRYIYFRVSSVVEAEDLTEEVFVRAWEALPDYQVTAGLSLAPWLYRIAHNLVVDYYRRQTREKETAPLFAVELPPPSPEEAVRMKQAAAGVISAVRQLGQVEQTVILLRFVEGLSYREISEVVGKSEGSCRVIQYRALAALRDLLNEKHSLRDKTND